jgi:hypothetical protein
LENLSDDDDDDDDDDINRAWESNKENIKTSAENSLRLHELTLSTLFIPEEN